MIDEDRKFSMIPLDWKELVSPTGKVQYETIDMELPYETASGKRKLLCC
jgi:hypothetical protein